MIKIFTFVAKNISKMSVLSENLRYLRATSKLSQSKLADKLIITRARYSKYEEGASEPPIDILKKIAAHYHISIDLLISSDVRRVPQEEINQVESIINRFRESSMG